MYFLPRAQLFVATQYVMYCLIHNLFWLSSGCYTMPLNIHDKQEEAHFPWECIREIKAEIRYWHSKKNY